MSEHLSGNAGIAQHIPKSVINPTLLPAPNEAGSPHNRWKGLAAATLTAAAIIVGPVADEQLAYADTPQAVIGMPFGGKWAADHQVFPPYNDSNSSHPSVHAAYGFNWATDVYAAENTDVIVNGYSPQGAVTFRRKGTSDTCSSYGAGIGGWGVTFDVLVNNSKIGEVKYDHLDLIDVGSNPIASGTKIGDVTTEPIHRSCFQVRHSHVQFKNTVSGNSCYVDHGLAGKEIPQGADLGVIGSGNSAPAQACATVPGTPPPPPPAPQNMLAIVDYSDAIWAKRTLGNGGWAQEAAPSSARQIAAGGDTRSALDLCNAVWTKSGGPGWSGYVQEAGCNSATKVAVSSNGTRMILDFCGAVWAKNGAPGWGGWLRQTECNSAQDIAIGGDYQVLLNLCNALWDKWGIGAGGWTQENDCGSTQKIAVSPAGVRFIVNSCGAVWAKRPGEGWLQGTGCDGVKAIAAGNGESHAILNACDAVWVKPNVGASGWIQETACGSARAVAMGTDNRLALIDHANTVYAKDGLGNGGWAAQTSAGAARLIEVG